MQTDAEYWKTKAEGLERQAESNRVAMHTIFATVIGCTIYVLLDFRDFSGLIGFSVAAAYWFYMKRPPKD